MSGAGIVTQSNQAAGSFQKRRLSAQFTKAEGSYAGTSSNQMTVSGLRMSANITMSAGISQGYLDLYVYGMQESAMNDLTVVQGTLPAIDGGGNLVTIFAGSDQRGMSIVYQGIIFSACAEYSNTPDVPFHVSSSAPFGLALKAATALSYSGATDVAVIMANLATINGLGFENNGVAGIFLDTPYFDGTAYTQIEDCARAAGIQFAIVNQKLCIWPFGASRETPVVPVISPETTLVGYPIRTARGVDFTTLFDPTIVPMGKIELRSSVKQASGLWDIGYMHHNLEAETPNGAWFSRVSCLTPGVLTGS